MNKEKVFAWIESLEDMADQSDRYFVERTELYKENQAKDKEIERLNKEKDDLDDCNRHLYNELKKKDNIINELEKWLQENIKISKAHDNQLGVNVCNTFLNKLKELKEGK